jgi:hypothetical protein
MSNQEIRKLLFSMTTIWTSFEVTPERIVSYELLLQDISYSNANKALFKIGRVSTFAPSPAEIRKAVEEISGTKRMTANEAWIKVLSTGFSTYTDPAEVRRLEPEIRTALEKAGRFYNLVKMEEDKARRLFMSAYEAIEQTQKREQMMLTEDQKYLGDGQ